MRKFFFNLLCSFSHLENLVLKVLCLKGLKSLEKEQSFIFCFRSSNFPILSFFLLSLGIVGSRLTTTPTYIRIYTKTKKRKREKGAFPKPGLLSLSSPCCYSLSFSETDRIFI